MTKKTTLKIELTNPCTEPWETMTPTAPNRRHCDSCAKEVIDFTRMSDRQMVQFFQNNTKPICGNYRLDQLNSNLEMIHYDRSSWRKVAAVVVALSVFGGQAMAQSSQRVVAQTEIQATNQETPKKSLSDSRLISGFVSDTDSGELLIGATVEIVGSYNGTGTAIDGYFELVVPNKNSQLKISYLGYSPQIIDLDNAPLHHEVELQTNAIDLREAVVTQYRPNNVQVDYTGGGTYLFTESLAEPAEKERILYLQDAEAFPNPSEIPPKIRLESPENHFLQIQLFNALGQLVWQDRQEVISGTNIYEISPDWNHWASGTYFLSLEDENDQKKMLSLVKS